MSHAAGWLCLLLCAIAVCGCGGDSPSPKERYEKQFGAALLRFKQRGASLRSDRSVRGQLTVLTRLHGFERQLEDELARIKPPAEVATAHRMLLSGLRRWHEGMSGRAIAELRAGHVARATAVFTHPRRSDLRAVLDARRARDIFRAKGYHLGINGGSLP